MFYPVYPRVRICVVMYSHVVKPSPKTYVVIKFCHIKDDTVNP